MADREEGTDNREEGTAGSRELGVGSSWEEGDAGVEESGADDAPDGGGDELAGVRELILKAYPDAVAELVAGESVDALLASVPAARAAYAQVAATIRAQTPAPVQIPTGSGRRPALDPEGLSPEAKIQAGLRQASL